MQLRTSIHLLPVDTAESPPAVVHAPVSSPLFGLLQNNVWNVRYAVNIYFVRRLCKGRPCHDVATQAQGIEFAFGNGTYVRFVIVGGVHDPSYVFSLDPGTDYRWRLTDNLRSRVSIWDPMRACNTGHTPNPYVIRRTFILLHSVSLSAR